MLLFILILFPYQLLEDTALLHLWSVVDGVSLSVLLLAIRVGNGVPSGMWIVVRSTWNLTSKLLESLTGSLWDQKRGTKTKQHDQRKDLHDVIDPWSGSRTSSSRWRADRLEWTEDNLCDNGTNLSGRGRDTVGGRAVTGWEDFSWHDEGSGVWAEVEEELSQDVKGEEAVGWELIICETDDDEESSEHSETHDLDWLASPDIKKRDGRPVTWKSTGTDEDEVANSGLVVGLVDVLSSGETDGGENDGVVERKSVVGNIKQEPGTGRTEENLAVLPLSVMTTEILPGSLWNLDLLWCLHGCETIRWVRVAAWLAVKVRSGILIGLLNVTLDIESVAWSLWDGETVVEGDATWDGTETNDDTPHLVDGEHADTGTGIVGWGRLKGASETSSNDQGHDSSSKLAETLHREDGTHHGTSPLGSRKLGSNDGRQWVVSTNSHTHDDTPEGHETNKAHGDGLRGESLREGGEDDDDKLETVHLFATNDVGEVSESKLSDNGTAGGSNLDGSVGVGWHVAAPVDDSKHRSYEVDGKT